MAYHKIPTDVDVKKYVEDMKALIMYSSEFDDLDYNPVKRIAEITGRKKRSIYGMFDEQNEALMHKVSKWVEFILAVITATGGHPKAKEIFEPEGYELDIKFQPPPEEKSLEAALTGFIPAVAKLQSAACDEKVKQHEFQLALHSYIKEGWQVHIKGCEERGWKP